MRKLFGMIVVLLPVAGYAAENSLQWAYPTEPPPGNNADAAAPARPVNQALVASTYTGLPKMPDVVARGSCFPACNATSPTAAPTRIGRNFRPDRKLHHRTGARLP